jgi:hypothetical protein
MHRPGVVVQHVDDLQPDRIAERLGDLREAFGVLDLDSSGGPAARRPGRPSSASAGMGPSGWSHPD